MWLNFFFLKLSTACAAENSINAFPTSSSTLALAMTPNLEKRNWISSSLKRRKAVNSHHLTSFGSTRSRSFSANEEAKQWNPLKQTSECFNGCETHFADCKNASHKAVLFSLNWWGPALRTTSTSRGVIKLTKATPRGPPLSRSRTTSMPVTLP